MPGDAREPTDYVRRLPIGERLSIGTLLEDELFPFEGQIGVKPLDNPRIPEPARRGEPGGDPCPACTASGEGVAWEDDHWNVVIDVEPHGLPMVAILLPKAHHDLEDLPPELTAELGSMIQRVAGAVSRIESVGRVHINRWGDGSQHFHIWFLGRPRGMWQMRGAMLAVWDDLLPKVPAGEWAANREFVARAIAAQGGTAT